MTLQKTVIGFGAGMLLIVSAFVAGSYVLRAQAAAPSGISTGANVASTTLLSVGAASAQLLIATSTCNSRVIGTAGSAVTLTFTDSQGKRPTGAAGNTQAASTTVAYDAGVYGCGAVWGFSYVAQTITVTDFVQ